MEPLEIAAWSFTASSDILANRECIREGLALAHSSGARVLATPECSLSGYPSAARLDWSGMDWGLLARCEQDLLRDARERGLVLILGTSARERHGITNQVLVGGPVGESRYRKRCLTPTDGSHFVAGDAPLVVTAWGWRLGLAVCYDLRFGDVWRDLACAGADALVVPSHMAGPDPDHGLKNRLIPAFCAVRAAETATPLILANTSAQDRYLDSGAWDARGELLASRAEGLLRCTLTHRSRCDPWYGQLHRTAMARWHNAASVVTLPEDHQPAR